MRKANRIKSIIWFILIVFIIFAMYLFIYMQIDKLIPKRENDIYTFAVDSQSDKTEFLYKMYDYILQFENYKKISASEIDNIMSNPKLSNSLNIFFRVEGMYSSTEEQYLKDILANAQIGKIDNTVYGDLNVILDKFVYYKKGKVTTSYTTYVFAYSDDFNKVFYFNAYLFDNIGYSNKIAEAAVDHSISHTEVEGDYNISQESANKQYDQGTNLIIQNVKQDFSKIFTDVNFNPDTVMYAKPYHILKDTENDITIYYDSLDKIICGFYMGFGNSK